MGARAGGRAQVDETFELASDEELLEIIKKRRKSISVKYEHTKWATIDVARAMSTAAGLIRFKAKKVGKVEIEPVGQDDMFSVVETFKRCLGEKVKVRTAFDPRRRRFVKLRKKSQ